QVISQKTQRGQSFLILSIVQGTWKDNGLMIGARSISFEGASVNETILTNKITYKIWLACVIGGILYIRNIVLRQTSSPGSYDVILVLRGDGTIELAQVVIRQREQSLKQSSRIHINEDEDQPEIINPTLLRRNIKCRYESRIISPTKGFSENGLQEDSQWILKTLEGSFGQSDSEQECETLQGVTVKAPLIDDIGGTLHFSNVDKAIN
ncbi:MAG: hypothetical protein EZS28_004611, partial [Streblomastix strix]